MKKRAFVLATAMLWSVVGPVKAADVEISGLVDVVQRMGDKRTTINSNFAGDSPFSDLRVKLFVDAWPSSQVGVMSEFLYDETLGSTNTFRADGAYLIFLGLGSPYLNVKAGKIPSPFGAWAPRTYSDKNPLIGLPLMYHYHTIAKNDRLPANYDSLQTYRAIRAPGKGGGMPILYDSCWNLGATIFGSSRRWEYNVGLSRGTPSSMKAATNEGVQIIGRVGVKPAIGLRLGASGAYGPYLVEGAAGVPKGMGIRDFKQRLFGVDAEYSVGHLTFNSEYVRNRWDSPNFHDGLANSSWYVEWRYTFLPGLNGAVRYSGTQFARVETGKGTREPWDSPVRRVESGLGYHFTQNARLKVIWQYTYSEDTTVGRRVDLVAGQLSVSF